LLIANNGFVGSLMCKDDDEKEDEEDDNEDVDRDDDG
jgi:hypothetical protein